LRIKENEEGDGGGVQEVDNEVVEGEATESDG
jgi:hypothetical protein